VSGPVEDRPPNDADVLARLRRAYTPYGWAILHDGKGTWTALNSRGPDIVKRNPTALRAAIDADHRNPTGMWQVNRGGPTRP
jgi:hypothetical protein